MIIIIILFLLVFCMIQIYKLYYINNMNSEMYHDTNQHEKMHNNLYCLPKEKKSFIILRSRFIRSCKT